MLCSIFYVMKCDVLHVMHVMPCNVMSGCVMSDHVALSDSRSCDKVSCDVITVIIKIVTWCAVTRNLDALQK